MNNTIDPSEIYMYVQQLLNPAINAKTIKHVHPTLKRSLTIHKKLEREFFLIVEI